jgi:hypothetical protein
MALGRCNYPDFKPTFHPERLKQISRFKEGDFVFVSSMGDIAWAGEQEITSIVSAIENSKALFLIQTKNPEIFLHYREFFSMTNVVHGVTIESNRCWNGSKAPCPVFRYSAIKTDTHPHKFLSIEPIMDFDLDIFTEWVMDINPEIIEIGADNYHNNLTEPSPEKLAEFIKQLEDAGLNVKQKDGLGRLLK